MVKIGNILYHNRNWLFPLFYVFLFVPSVAVSTNIPLMISIGVMVAFIGQLIRVATIGLVYIIRGGKNRRVYAEDLVTTGIFAHCRNPLYVGNILILVGLGIASNSLLFMAVITPLFLFIYQAIVRAEEDFLQNKFGQGYDDYCRDTNRWLPKLKGIGDTLRSVEFKWKRVIIREYNATFIWMVGAVLVTAMHFYHNPNLFDFEGTKWFFVGKIAFLTALYFLVRYLKKSKTIVSD